MKTSQEFWKRLAEDEVFAGLVSEEAKAKREAGASNYYETIIPIANEHGYELTAEELQAVMEKQSAELSEEELGKVAGGTSCPVLTTFISVTSIVSLAITIDVIKEI